MDATEIMYNAFCLENPEMLRRIMRQDDPRAIFLDERGQLDYEAAYPFVRVFAQWAFTQVDFGELAELVNRLKCERLVDAKG